MSTATAERLDLLIADTKRASKLLNSILSQIRTLTAKADKALEDAKRARSANREPIAETKVQLKALREAKRKIENENILIAVDLHTLKHAKKLHLQQAAPPSTQAPLPLLSEAEEAARSTLDGAAVAVKREPAVSGVYFLLQDSEVVYVGQSINVLTRLATHLTEDRKVFNRWCYLAVKRPELTKIESFYIRLLRPRHNVAGNRDIHNLGGEAGATNVPPREVQDDC